MNALGSGVFPSASVNCTLPTCPVEERHERPDGYRLMWAGMGENKAKIFTGSCAAWRDRRLPSKKPWLATNCGHLGMGNPTCTGSVENQRFCNNRKKPRNPNQLCSGFQIGRLPSRYGPQAAGRKIFPRCETVLVLCCFREIVIDTFVVCVCLSGLQSWLSD